MIKDEAKTRGCPFEDGAVATRRVSAGPFTLELPPNGVAILYEADAGGTDYRLPAGVGYLEALVRFAGEVIRLQAMVGQMRGGGIKKVECASDRELASLTLRMVVERMRFRIDAMNEHNLDGTSISKGFATQIVRACRRGAELLETPEMEERD